MKCIALTLAFILSICCADLQAYRGDTFATKPVKPSYQTTNSWVGFVFNLGLIAWVVNGVVISGDERSESNRQAGRLLIAEGFGGLLVWNYNVKW